MALLVCILKLIYMIILTLNSKCLMIKAKIPWVLIIL